MAASNRVTGSGTSQALPVFVALGDQTRLKIVARLCAGGPQSIVRLTAGASVSRQAVTKHLIWEVRTRRLAEVRRYLDQISRQWDAALGRLKGVVEADHR